MNCSEIALLILYGLQEIKIFKKKDTIFGFYILKNKPEKWQIKVYGVFPLEGN